jgi:hypothetical protein
LYLNYDDKDQKEMLSKYDDLTEDIDVEDIEDDFIRETIMKNQEKGVPPNPQVTRFKKFLLEEIHRSERKNRNIIEKF